MYVKVCGITSEADAEYAAEAGVDLIGVNLIPSSKRYVDPKLARKIIASVSERLICVAVIADLSAERARTLCREVGAHRLQLHGSETPDMVRNLSPFAYQALRIGGPEDIEAAKHWPGHPLLVDAKVSGQLGGTGRKLDWPPLRPLAEKRPLLLAGGLTPENVGLAVELVQPYGVDAASGVEMSGDPRRKNAERMRQFVARAREASRGSHRREFLS